MPAGIALARLLQFSAPQVRFENHPSGEAWVADVQLEDQVSMPTNARGECEAVLAVADLLVGDFDPSAVPDHGLQGKHGDF